MRRHSSTSEVPRAQLSYVVDGPADAPVVVLGSSLGTTVATWAPQLSALAARFRVVRFDHRGHASSWSPPAPWSIADLANDVEAMLDELRAVRVSYVGLSLGGMVGMWLAAHRPERIDNLTLVCTSAHLGAAAAWRARAAVVRCDGMPAVVDGVVERWFTPSFRTRRPDVVNYFKAMLAAAPAEGYARCCEALISLDLRDEVSNIVAPTVVVAGADDLAIPWIHGQSIADAVTGARFVVVRDAAHLANVEQPEQVTRIILEQLCGDRWRRDG
jgi:3-oxoadipate enol-lactonase